MQDIITKETLFKLLSERHKDNPYAKLKNLPSFEQFKDIHKASERVKKAINNKEKIVIVGDYDVDGVVSTAIMVDFFKQLNYEVDYIIPNRFEHGYGLSEKLIDVLDAQLVITVDNGISAVDAALLLKEKKIDLIITDHHTPGQTLPYATAIINPKQKECAFPFKEICGAQVAWYFCAALKKSLNFNYDISNYLDLLAIAIIADIMPMTHLNYTLVKTGLKKFKTSSRAALIQLNQLLKKNDLSSDDIGFLIAPKLNSAGRMDDASTALNFLLSDSIKEAQEQLEMLDELNNYRKLLQEQISQKAINEVRTCDEVVVVWGENWHEGVIGIVASKLANSYKRPAFVFSINNKIAKGSARANGEINLHSSISKVKHLLLGFGGHKNAAGLSLKEENLPAFKSSITDAIKSLNQPLHVEPNVLGELHLPSVDMQFLHIIEQHEPYGLNNTKPTFKISNAQILKYDFFGKEKNHLKLLLQASNVTFEAIQFNTKKKPSTHNNRICIIVSVNKNEFRGIVKTQFIIQQIIDY
jgi:single-stranded-DNA-specific exonuclease